MDVKTEKESNLAWITGYDPTISYVDWIGTGVVGDVYKVHSYLKSC